MTSIDPHEISLESSFAMIMWCLLEFRGMSQFSRIDENLIRYSLYKELRAIRGAHRRALTIDFC